MELGVDGVLLNIVVLGVKDFVKMVCVMKLVIEVGWVVFEVGCIEKK